MEAVLALAIGVLVGSGVWLLLRPRTFQVIIGLALLSYGVNLFIFAMGRPRVGAEAEHADAGHEHDHRIGATHGRRVGAGMAAVDSTSGQLTRTMSAPASSSWRTWSMVAAASAVRVLVIDCTAIGASPPTGTLPTMIWRDLRRSMWRQGRTSVWS